MSDLTIRRVEDETADPTVQTIGYADASTNESPVPSTLTVTGVSAQFAAPTSEGMQYEITGLPGGNQIIDLDTSMPGANEPEPMDPLALARLRLRQLKFARRVLKYQKREQKCAEARKTRTAKSRRKRTLEKASRKANRHR
jgi:hypothetical protein